MSNRNLDTLAELNIARDKLETYIQYLNDAKAATYPDVKLAKLTIANSLYQGYLAALGRAKLIYSGGISVAIGVGQGSGSITNLYADIYSTPNETLEGLGTLNKLFGSNGTNYVGAHQVLNLTITGRYKARDSAGNLRFWYRVEFLTNGSQLTVGWISDYNNNGTEAGMAWIRQNKPAMDDPSTLPEQDRDGELVYTLFYNGTLAPILYAPLEGNISVTNLRVGILRARAFALNSTHLGGAYHFFHIRIHYLNTSSQQWSFVEGWIQESRLPTPEVQSALQILTVNQTSEYAQKFDDAVNEGRIPMWQMPPRFSFYPVSIDQSCDPTQPLTTQNIDGLGIPENASLYGTPPYHTGTDFYAPENSSVYSIAPNGLVVGIGVGDNYNPTDHTSDRVNNTAYDWGSALVEYKRGYSVIVRYGHLYVLYGHLQSLEPTIFVGAPLNAGQRIGKIGRFNDPHVHVEVRNFDSPIGATWLQEGPQREYGFVTYAQVGAAARARHHYNIAQFFDSTVTAWSDDTATAQQTVTGFSPGITNGAQINLGNCTRTFRVNMNLQTVQDTAFGVPIQGLVQGVSNQALLIPPSSVPSV